MYQNYCSLSLLNAPSNVSLKHVRNLQLLKKIFPNKKEDPKENSKVEVVEIIPIKKTVSKLNKYDHEIEHGRFEAIERYQMDTMMLGSYRKLFGTYGLATKADMKALWPSEEELQLIKEKEVLMYPDSLPEMIKQAKREKAEKHKKMMERQEKIVKAVRGLEKEKQAILSKEREIEEEKEKSLKERQKLVDEVRLIVGYNISPFDPKFAEIVEKKEEDEKTKAKVARKVAKEQLWLDKALEISGGTTKKDSKEPQSDSKKPDSKAKKE